MLRVLIAEDEYLIRTGIIAAIPWHKLNMEVCGACENGLDALRAAREQRPDILITDLRMPGLDGLSLIRKLRQLNLACKVIVITCIEDFETLREAMVLKISAYLLKATMTSEELWNVLDQLRNEFVTEESSQQFLENHARLQKLLGQYVFQGGLSFEELCQTLPGLSPTAMRFRTAVLMALPAALSVAQQLKAEEKLSQVLPAQAAPLLLFHDRFCALLIRHMPAAEELQHLISALNLSQRCVCFSGEELMERTPQWRWTAIKRLEEHFFYPEAFALLSADAADLSESAKSHLNHLQNHPLCMLTPALGKRTALLCSRLRESYGNSREDFLAAAAEFAKLIQTFRFLSSGHPHDAQGSAPMVLQNLCSQMPDYDASLASTPAIAAMLQNIRQQFYEPQQLNDAAVSTHFSNSYFSMLFKKATGLSFTDYITATRLQNACEMLCEEKLSIREISDQCGFSDVTYFARCFKKKMGVSPRRWRIIQ